MRKAVLDFGHYQVKEGPTGGWRVSVYGKDQPISVHNNKDDAVAAAERYMADYRSAARATVIPQDREP